MCMWLIQGKLIKLFGKQLITKTKLKLDELPSELLQFPKIQQWLKVVGIRPNTLQVGWPHLGNLILMRLVHNYFKIVTVLD